jgi:hypothetical protein
MARPAPRRRRLLQRSRPISRACQPTRYRRWPSSWSSAVMASAHSSGRSLRAARSSMVGSAVQWKRRPSHAARSMRVAYFQVGSVWAGGCACVSLAGSSRFRCSADLTAQFRLRNASRGVRSRFSCSAGPPRSAQRESSDIRCADFSATGESDAHCSRGLGRPGRVLRRTALSSGADVHFVARGSTCKRCGSRDCASRVRPRFTFQE